VKARLGRHGVGRTLNYIFFVVCLERCGIRINNEFILDPSSAGADPTTKDGFALEKLTSMEQLSDSDVDFLGNYGELSAFGNRFARGQICLIVRADNGDLAGAYWYGPRESDGISRDGMIDHCFTRHDYRGHGLYPWALRYIASTTSGQGGDDFSRLYIECSAFNYSSAAGIRKAGFVHSESVLTIGNLAILRW
tara:strand:- start:62404 stop:62985 length:582 start_codon:yes stop_codon:yes gene_type:complete